MKNLNDHKTIYIIGIGPGHTDYILPMAQKTIQAMDFIAAGKRNQEHLKLNNQEIYTIKGSLSKLKEAILECAYDKRIGIVVSGDPSFYSLLQWTKRNFKEYTIKTIPGISSVQYFFNQLNKSHHKSYWVSLHGRDNEYISHLKNHRFVALLTDANNTPYTIAKNLIYNKCIYKIYVGEDLSYTSERITSGLPKKILQRNDYKPSVVIIENENYKG